jgi:predicted double-glycine peptidase
MTFLLPHDLYISKAVVSLREARYTYIVPQRYDLSCGAAALATILKYYYNDPVDEAEIARYMIEYGDQEQIAKKGFSLLDLKKYAEARHYVANGYKVSLERLIEGLQIPAIVLITTGRYSHFVVLKAIRGDQVYVADPAFGNRATSVEDFAKNWNGVVFLVVSSEERSVSEMPLRPTLPASTGSVITFQEMGMQTFSFFQRLSGEF